MNGRTRRRGFNVWGCGLLLFVAAGCGDAGGGGGDTEPPGDAVLADPGPRTGDLVGVPDGARDVPAELAPRPDAEKPDGLRDQVTRPEAAAELPPGDVPGADGPRPDTAPGDARADAWPDAAPGDAPADGLGDAPPELAPADLPPESALPDLFDSADVPPEVVDAVGVACRSPLDCPSGLCLATGAGAVCTVPCTTECPDGWVCRAAAISGPDLVPVCVPQFWRICGACSVQADCDTDRAVCVTVGADGDRCAMRCFNSGECPAGFGCATGPGGQPLCLPVTGSCSCRQGLDGLTRRCSVTNEYGSCPGEQSCSAELGWGSCRGAPPRPEVCNGQDDNCDGQTDEGLPDTDADGIKDCLDPDDDGDGYPDDADNCPLVASPDLTDTDQDGLGDVCDPDDDGDGIADGADNCPRTPNPDQADLDQDRAGDPCDDDDDGDVFPDIVDRCPTVYDPDQTDTDDDGLGDACDGDDDNDGVFDTDDNCPLTANAGQENCDGDGPGDVCDPDDDNDATPDPQDCGPCDPTRYPEAPEVCNGIDEDCDGTVDDGTAAECFPYACGGTRGCTTRCDALDACAPGYFCDGHDANGDGRTDDCTLLLPDGSGCTAAFECAAGYCGNAHCCGAVGASCCATDADCTALGTAAVCDAPASCTGHHVTGVCNAAAVCEGAQVADPTGCTGQVCAPGRYCAGAAIHEDRYCDAGGGCTVDGAFVQNCQGSNACCNYGCANAACWNAFRGDDAGCVLLCLYQPVLCFCW